MADVMMSDGFYLTFFACTLHFPSFASGLRPNALRPQHPAHNT